MCIANILEGDMMSLQDRLIAYTKPGGMLVLSGMVASQVNGLMSQCLHAPTTSLANCRCSCH